MKQQAGGSSMCKRTTQTTTRSSCSRAAAAAHSNASIPIAAYALHADTCRVFGWKVGAGGELAAVGSANGLPLTAAGLAAS